MIEHYLNGIYNAELGGVEVFISPGSGSKGRGNGNGNYSPSISNKKGFGSSAIK